jgi:hypothetical protein
MNKIFIHPNPLSNLFNFLVHLLALFNFDFKFNLKHFKFLPLFLSIEINSLPLTFLINKYLLIIYSI